MLDSYTEENNKNIDEISLTDFSPISPGEDIIEDFHQGLYYLYNDNLLKAKKYLLLAVNCTEPFEECYFEYLSFLGLVEVLSNKSRGGLNRCYDALKAFSTIPELYINLAYAELSLGDRRRSIIAIEKSLRYHSDCIYSKRINDCIGKRNGHQLKNTNPRVNLLGKFLRRKRNQCLGNTLEEVFSDMLCDKLDLYVKNNT